MFNEYFVRPRVFLRHATHSGTPTPLTPHGTFYQDASISPLNASASTSARLVARSPTATTPRRPTRTNRWYRSPPSSRQCPPPRSVLFAFSLATRGGTRVWKDESRHARRVDLLERGGCPAGCPIDVGVDADRGGRCEWQNQNGTTGPARRTTPARVALD